VRDGASWSLPQRLKNDLLYGVIRLALGGVLRLPRRAVAGLCHALGAIAYRLLRRERAWVEARLAAGFGGKPAPRLAKEAFLTAGATLADTLALFDPSERAGRTLALDAASHAVFRAALAEGRGVVFVAAHLGSWERMAALLVEEGFPVATVARESYDPRLTQLYDRLRGPRGVRSIYRGRPGAAAAIVRELRAGRAVGFLIDLPARVQSEPVRLFGAWAAMPVGAARIALGRRAAVVVGTPMPRAGAGPAVRIERIQTDDLAPDPDGARALTTRLARALDARIAAWPEAWLGLYAPGGVEVNDPPPPPRLRRARDPR
jgi:KDO2-lipid IV(A) lauroyltransferase